MSGWQDNDRGVSFVFGKDIVEHFLQENDLDLICRAHQVVEDGYEFFADRKLVTVFSAPNYCGEFDNYGGVLTVDENLKCNFKLLKPLIKTKNLMSLKNRNATPPKIKTNQYKIRIYITFLLSNNKK